MPIFIPRKPEVWQRKLSSPVRLRENHWAADRLTAAFPLTGNGGEFIDLVDGIILGAQNGAILGENSSGDVVAETYVNGTKYFKHSAYEPYEPTKAITIILGVKRTSNTIDTYGKILNYGSGLSAPWGSYVIEQVSGSTGTCRAYIAVNGTRYLTPNFSGVLGLTESLQLTLKYDGSTLALYKNNVLLGFVSAPGTMSGSYGAEGLSIGARHDGQQRYTADYDYLWMFHDSALDNDELQSLYEAPYQFLQTKKTYFPLATATTGLSVNPTRIDNTPAIAGITVALQSGLSVNPVRIDNVPTIDTLAVALQSALLISPIRLDNVPVIDAITVSLPPTGLVISPTRVDNVPAIATITVAKQAPLNISLTRIDNTNTLGNLTVTRQSDLSVNPVRIDNTNTLGNLTVTRQSALVVNPTRIDNVPVIDSLAVLLSGAAQIINPVRLDNVPAIDAIILSKRVLNDADVQAIVDGVWSKVIEKFTAEEMMRVFMATLSGEREGLGTGTEYYYSVDGLKPRITLTADKNGNGIPKVDGTL